METAMITTESSNKVRYHGPDALRAWAMSMGIVLHAAWLMVPGGAGSPMEDASASRFTDYLLLAIHSFRMQLFFVLAGLFAGMMIAKRGCWHFTWNRVLRIAIPFLISMLVLCPIMVHQYNLGAIQSGAAQGVSSAWELTRDYFKNIAPENTLMVHLWFLYYLCLIYVVVLLLRGLLTLVDNRRRLRDWISTIFGGIATSRYAVFLLAAFLAPLMFPMKGSWGIDVDLGSLYPKWPGFFSYTMLFIMGWLIYRNIHQLDLMLRNWRWQLVIGCVLTVPYYFYAHFAIYNGYTTWGYPGLVVSDIQYDHLQQRYRYAELRTALLDASPNTIPGELWKLIPEANQKFIREYKSATNDQLGGLLVAINLSILGSTEFTSRVNLSTIELSTRAKSIANEPASQRTKAENRHLNREILESGLVGILLTEDIHRPFYFLIRAVYSYAYSVITWLLIFGCLGLFHTYCNSERRFWRYFSDSSYWMYLAHLPIQFQMLLWIGNEPWYWPIKFLVYVFGTLAVLLPSYHFMVRPTWIGWLLNGKMVPLWKRDPKIVESGLAKSTPTG
jgi:Acyltransferase family